MSFFLHLLPSSFIPVPFPTSPFEVSMLCNDLDGQCRPFYLPSYQSPCGDSFHFNIPAAGYIFQWKPRQVKYQSPCGDSFHFNFDTARQFEIERESINPLAGILFISTLEPLIYDQYCEKYQSPCGDSFHFNKSRLDFRTS